MRYFRSTKDNYERETEEAERLVRPAPKVKPPRHDRRRELVQDDDLKSDVKTDLTNDLSLNYKGSRVLERFLSADIHRVRVRNKDTGNIYEVTPERLKEHGDAYEVVSEDEEPGESEEGLTREEQEEVNFARSLLNHIKEDKNFGIAINKATIEGLGWDHLPDSTPLSHFSDLSRSKELLDRFPTLGDLRDYQVPQWVADHIQAQEEKAKKAPSKSPEPAEPKTPEPEAPKPEAAPPVEEGLPAEKPQEKPQEGSKEGPSQEDPKSEQEPEKPKPKKTPKIKLRDVTPEEQDRAKMALIENFPVDVSRKLLSLQLHPDDVTELVDSFKLVRSEPIDSIQTARDLVGDHYQLNPSKVKPPRYGMTEAGLEVPFEELSPREQQVAARKHALRSVAMSLAARQSIVDHLGTKTHAPEELLTQLADFTLETSKGEPPAKTMDRAQKAAKSLFHDTVESGTLTPTDNSRFGDPSPSEDPDPVAKPTKDLTPNQVKSLLKELDTGGQQVAVGFLQARDYLKAWNRYLSTSGPEQITEHQTPKQIWNGIRKAEAFFEDQSEKYPPELQWAANPAGSFRNRVLSKIRTLAPHKFKPLQRVNELHEDKEFERRSEKWDSVFGEDSPYRKQGFIPPPKPMAPAGYAARKGKPEEVGSLRDQMIDEHKRQTERLASSLVSRFLTNSSYPYGVSMGETKKAVYWGVKPYPKGHEGFEPYQEWTQAHQRDYGPSDASALLKSAREWLETPVLTQGVEGIVRDTQLRAALDLAIRTHKDGAYSAGLHPAEYNKLLAKLAGEDPNETLLTVQAAVKAACGCHGNSNESNDSLYRDGVGETPMKASSKIRALATKYASNPEVAYDLIDLATKVAQEEQQAQEAPAQEESKQAGEVPPEFLEQQEKKKDEAKEEPKSEEGQDKTAAYNTLRSHVIRLAHANPTVREAYLPLLKTIKDLGR